MSRAVLLAFFVLAVFVQAGTYGLTFLLPDLSDTFGADETPAVNGSSRPVRRGG